MNHIRRSCVCIAIWTIPLLLVSCGGSRSFVVQQRPAAPLKTFGQVVVEPFTVDGVEKLGLTEKTKALDIAAQITQYLNKRLAGKDWFKGSGQTLTIKGLIVGFDPGSQAARFWLGFGAGKGKIIVDTTFSNSAGDVVARGNSSGTVSGGWFGGSTNSACDRVAIAIIDFISANYETLD